jgi:Fe2+ transport system protein B
MGTRGSGAVVFLGACPRIGILFKTEAFREDKHRHIANIPSIIFPKQRKVWLKGHSRTGSYLRSSSVIKTTNPADDKNTSLFE